MEKTILYLVTIIIFSLMTIVINASVTFASTEISSSVGWARLTHDSFEVSPTSTEIVKVFGSITNVQPGDKITIIFTMPDDETEGSQLFPTKEGFFETFMMLDSNSQPGTYTVFVSIGTNPIGSLTFSVTQKQVVVQDNTTPSLPVPKFVERIIFTTDKKSYSDLEKIKISGDVKQLLEGTSVSIQVFNPDGNLVTVVLVILP